MAKEYERVEVTFSKKSDIEMKIYKHLEEESEIIGKGKYIKQLLKKDMDKKATEE